MTAAPARGDHLARHGAVLIDNGYLIVPITAGSKAPKSIDDWQDIEADHPRLEQWIASSSKNTGVGILTKRCPAVDIDVLDVALSASMVEWVVENVGDGLKRIGMAPKTLLLFRTDKPFRKVTSASFIDPANPRKPDGKPLKQRIEILGDGQQFVAYHIHPDTKEPYYWPDDHQNPLDTAASALPVITEKLAREICIEFERQAITLGWAQAGNASADLEAAGEASGDVMAEIPPPEETATEVARVKSAIEKLKEIISDATYEEWFSWMAALKWTRWECALDLARELSEASDKHEDEHFLRTWRGLQKRTRGREFTLGTIFHVAKENDWEAPFETRTHSEELSELAKLIEDVDFLDENNPPSAKFFKEIVAANLNTINVDKILQAIKKAAKIGLPVLRKALADARKPDLDGELPTHAGYAQSMLKIARATSGGVEPVGVAGSIFTFDEGTGVFTGRETAEFTVDVAKKFDGQEKCERRADYMAIAQHAYAIVAAGNNGFFKDAPIGLACEGRFYKVTDDGKIVKEELSSRHRQRMLSKYVPEVGQMPLFKGFLDDTFKGDPEQIALLQEVFGATLIGMMAKYEKVVMMKGVGRSGKGTIQKLLAEMIPPDFVGAVPPELWDRDTYAGSIANLRLNLVGELDDSVAIPAAAFKTVTGRDLVNGRHLYGNPFKFYNQAAHVFSTNHFIPTKDHSTAFYGRWILIWFKHSRADLEHGINADLVRQIIDSGEMPAITAWSLQGAKRLAARGEFLETTAHQLLMAQWRERSSPLMEFLCDGDEVRLDPNASTPRKFVYDAYQQWCRESNRRPLGKIKFYDEIRDTKEIGAMGVKLVAAHDGRDMVKGMALKTGASAFMDESGGDDDNL